MPSTMRYSPSVTTDLVSHGIAAFEASSSSSSSPFSSSSVNEDHDGVTGRNSINRFFATSTRLSQQQQRTLGRTTLNDVVEYETKTPRLTNRRQEELPTEARSNIPTPCNPNNVDVGVLACVDDTDPSRWYCRHNSSSPLGGYCVTPSAAEQCQATPSDPVLNCEDCHSLCSGDNEKIVYDKIVDLPGRGPTSCYRINLYHANYVFLPSEDCEALNGLLNEECCVPDCPVCPKAEGYVGKYSGDSSIPGLTQTACFDLTSYRGVSEDDCALLQASLETVVEECCAFDCHNPCGQDFRLDRNRENNNVTIPDLGDVLCSDAYARSRLRAEVFPTKEACENLRPLFQSTCCEPIPYSCELCEPGYEGPISRKVSVEEGAVDLPFPFIEYEPDGTLYCPNLFMDAWNYGGIPEGSCALAREKLNPVCCELYSFESVAPAHTNAPSVPEDVISVVESQTDPSLLDSGTSVSGRESDESGSASVLGVSTIGMVVTWVSFSSW